MSVWRFKVKCHNAGFENFSPKKNDIRYDEEYRDAELWVIFLRFFLCGKKKIRKKVLSENGWTKHRANKQRVQRKQFPYLFKNKVSWNAFFSNKKFICIRNKVRSRVRVFIYDYCTSKATIYATHSVTYICHYHHHPPSFRRNEVDRNIYFFSFSCNYVFWGHRAL